MTIFVSVYAVSDIATLKSEYPSTQSAIVVLGPNFPIEDSYMVYIWNPTSTATPDDFHWVLSDFPVFATTGRWEKIDSEAKPQVNADWNANSGVSFILNKPWAISQFVNDLEFVTASALSGYVTSGFLTGTLANYVTSSALTTALATKFGVPSGTTSQYIRGDGSLATLPTVPAKTFSNTTRTLNTAFQVSTTRDAFVTYTVDISVTSLVLAGTSGRVYLEYADDSGFTTNVVTVSSSPSATSGVLNVTNLGSGNVSGVIPAGKYVRIRTANVAGSPTFTYQGSQEVLM